MSFSTAGGSWPLSMRRAGLYVSGITGTEVDQISSAAAGTSPGTAREMGLGTTLRHCSAGRRIRAERLASRPSPRTQAPSAS